MTKYEIKYNAEIPNNKWKIRKLSQKEYVINVGLLETEKRSELGNTLYKLLTDTCDEFDHAFCDDCKECDYCISKGWEKVNLGEGKIRYKITAVFHSNGQKSDVMLNADSLNEAMAKVLLMQDLGGKYIFSAINDYEELNPISNPHIVKREQEKAIDYFESGQAKEDVNRVDERNKIKQEIILNGQTSFANILEVEKTSTRPKIVCLCGSTRFFEAFQTANYKETMKGHIVLSVGCFKGDYGWGQAKPEVLDELHKRKIELADEVLILNVNGYIGESTRNEIIHALAKGKPIRYLETPAATFLEISSTPQCCYVAVSGTNTRCERKATHRIIWGDSPDDYTESCISHIGCLISDRITHTIELIESSCAHPRESWYSYDNKKRCGKCGELI